MVIPIAPQQRVLEENCMKGGLDSAEISCCNSK